MQPVAFTPLEFFLLVALGLVWIAGAFVLNMWLRTGNPERMVPGLKENRKGVVVAIWLM